MNGKLICVLLGTLALAGCAVQHVDAKPAKAYQRGKASWYGSESGHRTANGERHHNKTDGVAHRTLPFNTKLKITDDHTGKSVVCRVNDRGPFIKGRVVDLSKGCAAGLPGFIPRGVASVTVEVVK